PAHWFSDPRFIGCGGFDMTDKRSLTGPAQVPAHDKRSLTGPAQVPAHELERHRYDVVVIGAGGAGLRAAIEARLAGKKTAIISKSLFGKAHTVMAEGGAAAAMGNVNSTDNWMVHFR